ncbi:MAG: hypothetical protein RL071_1316 [Pseudomonadota bacterium]
MRLAPIHAPVACSALPLALLLACAPKEPAPSGGGGDDTGAEEQIDVEVADFEVQLTVVVPQNQPDLFDIVSRVDLEISDAEGDLGPFSFSDVADGGGPIADGLPALTAAVFTLRAYDGDGALLAVGRSEPVDATTGPQEVRVFMGRARSIGWLDALQSADGSERGVYAGALVALGGGTFQLYGGTARVAFGSTPALSADDGVWELNLNDVDGGLRFERVGDMPPTDAEAEAPGRAAHTATLLRGDHADDGLVLIAGGSTDYLDAPNASADLTLYDPLARAVVAQLVLPSAVFQHTATLTSGGRVVLSGGSRRGDAVGGIVGSTRIQIFEPGDRTISSVTVSDTPWMWEATAALRDGGVLICGASIYADTVDEAKGCGLVTVGGSYTSRAALGISMPEALYHPSMVTLENGDVLLVGGLLDAGASASPRYVADPRVWRLAEGATSWEPIGNLRIARGLASVALLPTGDLLIAGRVSSLATQLFPEGDAAISCVERFIVDAGVSKFVPATVETIADEPNADCDPGAVEGGLRQSAAQPLLALDPTDTNLLLVGGQAAAPPVSPEVAIYFPEL